MENNGSIFTSVMKKRQKRSSFNLSHDLKLSLDMGIVVPQLVQECIPGDTFTISSSAMLRMAPLVSPVMHKINVYMEYFFVPNRILWGNWETFITGSRNGKQLAELDLPQFPTLYPYRAGQFLNENGSLSDYLGIPTPESFVGGIQTSADDLTINALPFAAYQMIWDEYYRDENLIESMYDVVDPLMENYNQLPDGIQPMTVSQQLSSIRPRAWEHDYFTSALPWAQKGEEVTIPMDLTFDSANWTKINRTDGGSITANDPLVAGGGVDNSINVNSTTGFGPISVDNTEAMGNQATINDLRAAIKLQEWLETNARGGSRYFESIYAHFGVKSPDARLNRPEFIGSSKSNMIISEVLQTSSPQSDADTPQGNMSGHGQNVSQTKRFKYYCQEHGFIVGMVSVMPTTAYFQGVERFWLKTDDRLQYYFPEFAHLGEQEILNSEIYFMPDNGTVPGWSTFDTFGYTPRYAEYKFKNSRVAGDFRETLKFWHLGRDFAGPPVLNDNFVSSDPSKRIFAVQDLPQDSETPSTEGIRDYHSIYAHIFHDVKASRLMPKYGTPIL